MALEAYNKLEKELNGSASSPDDTHSDRLSLDSDEPLDEYDPLTHNGARRTDGNGTVFLSEKAPSKSAFRAWTDYWGGTLRSYIERFIPIDKIEHHPYARRIRRRIPSHAIRRVRRKLGLTVPGRILGFIAVCFATIVLLIIGSGAFVYKKSGTHDGQSPPWYPSPLGGTLQSWEKSYRRASIMVKEMTLAEKVNVTTGTGWSMGLCVGNTGPATGVGFPSLCLQDGPLGLRFADNITASPAGITVGATWNTDLMYKRGRMMGVEARMKGVNVILGPSVGPLGKMPAGGRNFEAFGSDPVLQGIAAAQTVRGIQEEDVMATIKHFVGNEQEHFRQSFEWGLPNAISTQIDDRTLHEVYAWPFADAIRVGVASLMCSYNQVNNSYACQNSKLLNGIVKDEMGFQGFIQSDWLAQRSGVASTLAGLDMSMPGDGLRWAEGKALWGPHLTKSVLNGTVPIQRLNDMVTRVVAAWHQLGQNDLKTWPKPPPEGDGGPNFSSWTNDQMGLLHHGSPDDNSTTIVNKFVDSTAGGSFSHRSLSRAIAAEGIVLLKNEDEVLPLSRDGWSQADEHNDIGDSGIFKIAIVGEDSRQADGGPNVCEDRACNKGTLATGWGSGAVEFPYLITPLEALQHVFHEDKVKVTSFPTNTLPSTINDTSIEDQDLCIVFVNADGGEGFRSYEGIKGDRNDLELQHHGNALIADVAARCGLHNKRDVGPNVKSDVSSTIVVIHSVGPVIVEPFIDVSSIRAVLQANLPGQESGNALADVLLGDVNPSGHLPYTMGKSLKDYGPGAQVKYYPNNVIPQQAFTEGLLIDYRWFDDQDITPRFPFGYGLSYTKFVLSDLVVTTTNPFDKPDLQLPPRPDDETEPPNYSMAMPSPKEAIWPDAFRRLKKYVYPYISQSEADTATTSFFANPHSPAPEEAEPTQQRSPAGGGQGGHPALWDVLATVEVTVENVGSTSGQAVIQLYLRFPADGQITDAASGERITFPKRVLRGFEKVKTYAKAEKNTRDVQVPQLPQDSDLSTKRVKFELTRRDLSYWDVRRQSWVLPDGGFWIEVGFSARDLPLEVKLW